MADDAGEIWKELRAQAEGFGNLFGQIAPAEGSPEAEAAVHWAEIASRLHTMWTDFQVEQLDKPSGARPHFFDPLKWIAMGEGVMRSLPLSSPDVQQKLWNDVMEVMTSVLGQYGLGPRADLARDEVTKLPREDRRFADPAWRSQPFFALLHQVYLLLSERIVGLAEEVEGIDPARKAQLVFAARVLVDALSPANFPLTNPTAIGKARETSGESLVRGFEHLLHDLGKGQLTHTDPSAFKLGENIAVTPGKVVYETDLFQIIQYMPLTEKVLATPLVIFPPWINRFYILDLNPGKSFVKWALEQGLTVFMISWKSADASMAELAWDDYIGAQIEAMEFVRERLKVPAVHTIGYCVAGTTLAATLAVLARNGEADRVASATFLAAQVDFEEAGDLRNFIDDQQIETLGSLSSEGYLDGRYMAATFNLLRGNDLIWSHVEKNYLKGEERPAFDLLHWNGDVTNLPARWHREYLRDLYRDNRLVVADSLQACGVPIDLHRITTPIYVQAGREDHIAPPSSVWKLMHNVAGPRTFVLAGSGHIAGVINPPSSAKYQYWVNDAPAESLESFIAAAKEHPGSWWPHWSEWIRSLEDTEVPARGKRRPGGRGDKIIEDAPGRYVTMR